MSNRLTDLIGQHYPRPKSGDVPDAIPTVYKGIHFRSRVEIRWARFFEAIDVPFEYEKQHYDLGKGLYYLPDFWLPTVNYGGVWIEIKGQEPTNEEATKATKLAVLTQHPVYIFFGDVWLSTQQGNSSAYKFFVDYGMDRGYQWCECSTCGKVGIQYRGYVDHMPCHRPKFRNEYRAETPRLQAAYLHARQTRFEEPK